MLKDDQERVSADQEIHLGSLTNNSLHTEKTIDQSHAPVESRKKKDKKKQREKERKARRASEKKSAGSLNTDPISGNTEVNSPSGELPPTGTLSQGFLNNSKGIPSATPYRLSEGDLEAAKETIVTPYRLSEGDLEAAKEIIDPTFTPSQDLLVDSVDEDKSEKNPSLYDDAYLSSITHKLPTLSPNVNEDETQSAQIPASKIGRHEDWFKFFDFLKVDGLAGPIFMPGHPSYGNQADCSFPGCPFEASKTPDCPYHKTYCNCIDPLNPKNNKCIVYADVEPFHIGPFNYMQGQKLVSFFAAQPEIKNKLMLLDEDLYPWLCSPEGRNWKVDRLKWTDIQYQPVPRNMPMQLMWEVDAYFREHTKGSALKQVDCFQQLAARNARLKKVSCHPAITKEFLEAMQKKCETRPFHDAICYCKDNRPTSPDNDKNLIRCAYRECQIKWFHRTCIEKVGYDRVTTWYCGVCERYMRCEARKATSTFRASQSSNQQPTNLELQSLLNADGTIA